MSDRILVTGGAGFIGSHVCEQLTERGHEIWLLDSFDASSYPAEDKRRNIAEISGRSTLHVVEGDVRDTVLLAGLLSDVSFDAVVHLAARPGMRASVDDPDASYDVNVRGTLRLLEAMNRHSVRRLTLASSTSVYGDGGAGPYSEEDDTGRPSSPEAAGKRAAELLAHVYHVTHGFSVHCLRLSGVYGPRQRPDQEIHRLARLLEAGDPVTVDDVRLGRDHVYVGDAAEAIRLSLEHFPEPKKSVYEIFNVTGPDCPSPHRLASELAAAMQVTAVRLPADGADVGGRCVSGDRARTVLGFEPEVGLERGVRLFADWIREQPTRLNGDRASPAVPMSDETVVPSGAGEGDRPPGDPPSSARS